MNYLKWNLDTEEDIDPYDPLGNIEILGDEGKLTEEYTYLDAFFEALIEAVKYIEVGKSISIDPMVEPNNLQFDCEKEALKIIYGQQQAIILNKDQFIDDVQKAVKNLLKILDRQSELAKQQKPKLIKLRSYLNDRKQITLS